MNTQASAWSDALRTGKEPMVLDLAELVFYISSLVDMLDKLGIDKDKEGINFDTKTPTCLTLLTFSLLNNGLYSLEDL